MCSVHVCVCVCVACEKQHHASEAKQHSKKKYFHINALARCAQLCLALAEMRAVQLLLHFLANDAKEKKTCAKR